MFRMTNAEYSILVGEKSLKKNKYRNQRIIIDGVKFDSVKEANRWSELLILVRAGEISNLKLQVKFALIPKSRTERATNYVADFVYQEGGKTIVEDVKTKPTATRAYILKRKLFKQLYPQFEFRECF